MSGLVENTPKFETFLATVDTVLYKKEDFLKLNTAQDFIKVYNGNKNFDAKDARFLGAITFVRPNSKKLENYAFPFDKNNMTFPIKGEVVVIIKADREYYWLPYTITQYPNYRSDYKTVEAGKGRDIQSKQGGGTKDAGTVKSTGTPAKSPAAGGAGSTKKKREYVVSEKIKFLKPKEGDTVITGRWGQTIRFSELFLTEDDKTSSPSIFIRNFQNPELDKKPIGELVEEDFMKDGSSLYMTSKKVKIKFDTSKFSKFGKKKAYTLNEKGSESNKYPTDADFKDVHQIWVNTERIIMSARTKEILTFAKKTIGFFTDERFSIDAGKDIYGQADNHVIWQCGGSGKQIFLKSDKGEVYLGKNDKFGMDGAAVQKMVLGGELVKILSDLIDEINKQWYPTPSGPTPKDAGPLNKPKFIAIQKKLKVILSETNFLSKNK